MAINQALFSSAKDDWETPPWFFKKLDDEFHFTLDVCAQENNKKCTNFFSPEQDGLTQSWKGNTCYCNPPYGREIPKWVKKAWEETREPGTSVVMLIPSRTDTKVFWNYIWEKPRVKVRFLKGRIKFVGAESAAPFPSMLVLFGDIAE